MLDALDLASMRPRHYTAENLAVDGIKERLDFSFNEAAALHRGKPLVTDYEHRTLIVLQ